MESAFFRPPNPRRRFSASKNDKTHASPSMLELEPVLEFVFVVGLAPKWLDRMLELVVAPFCCCLLLFEAGISLDKRSNPSALTSAMDEGGGHALVVSVPQ